jgi:conjugal transfer pilus assembly protein TraU
MAARRTSAVQWLCGIALLSIVLLGGNQFAYAAIVNPPCNGKWLNPISDICWECLLPISIGPTPLATDPNYTDTANPAPLICMCPIPLPPFVRLGVSISFWQPSYLAEVTRSPYCMMNLGGTQLPEVLEVPGGTHAAPDGTTKDETSFYQVHWMPNFWVEWLVGEIDTGCYEKSMLGTFFTELDPTWDDDELAFLLAPESILFANVIAQAACGADCLAATAGLPITSLFWCMGCQGGTYPLTGHVNAHEGGIQAATRLVERLGFKMSRLGSLPAAHAHSPIDYCFQHFDPIMDRTQYRTQLTYPIPETSNAAGGCCQSFGHSSFIWGSGKEYPYKGEDFAFIVTEKRSCCFE